jgi:carbon storage regulator
MATGNVTLPGVMEGPVAANNIMEGSNMLVLSRKVGESILISESIRVTVVQAANGRIRLGIDAPPEVIVLREELTMSCSNSSPSKNGKER